MVFEHDKREGRQKRYFHERGLQVKLSQTVTSSPVAFWHGSQIPWNYPAKTLDTATVELEQKKLRKSDDRRAESPEWEDHCLNVHLP